MSKLSSCESFRLPPAKAFNPFSNVLSNGVPPQKTSQSAPNSLTKSLSCIFLSKAATASYLKIATDSDSNRRPCNLGSGMSKLTVLRMGRDASEFASKRTIPIFDNQDLCGLSLDEAGLLSALDAKLLNHLELG
ncbi:MAG: hypothetical protein PF441_05915 [Desulfuromusa sp.]|nr:hypothetical protein [Desulfuromusa sp.]